MTILDLISKRKSIQTFSNKKIEREKIGIILETSRWVSSPDKLLCIEMIVVDDEDIINDLATKASLPKAKVYISILTNNLLATKKYGNEAQSILSLEIGAIIQAMQLAAQDQELGMRWVFTNEKVIKPLLEIPEEYGAKNILLLGYPKETMAKDPSPYPVTDIIFLNEHGKKFKPFYEGIDWQGLKHYSGEVKKRFLGKKGIKK